MEKWFAGVASKKRRVLLIMVILLLWVLVLQTVISDNRIKREAYLNSELQSFQSKMTASLKTYEKFSEYVFERVVNQPEILWRMARVSDADDQEQDLIRQELLEILQPEYAYIKAFDFRQFHLHTSEGISFLRLHAPEKFGDDLMAVRESVRIANTDHRKVIGFEEGRIYNGYRFVYPLTYQEDPVGSVEISISMNTMIHNMNELYPGIFSNFMISETAVREVLWEEELHHYVPHPYLEGFFCDSEIKDSHPGIDRYEAQVKAHLFDRMIQDHPEDIAALKSFSELVNYEGSDYLINFIQIRNIKGDPVAYLVGLSRNTEFYGIYNHLISDILYVSVLFIILIIGVLIYLSKQTVLEMYSTVDQLTNVFNRHKFLELAQSELKDNRLVSSVIILDIDDFKRINDRHGHSAGDEVLRDISATILEHVRDIDLVGRWGGEEFIILLPRTEFKVAAQIAERLRKALSGKTFIEGETVTASFGLSTCTAFETLEEAIHRADQAMYESKRSGRNQVTRG